MPGGGEPTDRVEASAGLASAFGGLNVDATEGGSSSRVPASSSSSVTPGQGRADAVSTPAADRPGLLTCQVLSCLATTGKNGAPLLMCAGCGCVAYCCKDHQKLDWSLHKLFCKNVGKDGPLAPVVPDAELMKWMTAGMNDEQRGRWNAARVELWILRDNKNPAQHAFAVKRAKAVLSDLEAFFGRNHVGTVVALHTVAMIFINRAMFDDALSFTLRVLKIVDDRYGPEDVKNDVYLNHYASVLRGLGRYEEALVQHQRTLRMSEAAYGLNSQTTATYVSNVAVALCDLGRMDEAIPLIRRSLAIQTALDGASSLSNSLVMLRTNLAGSLGHLGQFAEAWPLFEGAIKSVEMTEGRNSLTFVRVSANYAASMCNSHQGDPVVIVGMFEHAISVLESMHGERDLEFIMHLNNAAQANGNLGRWRRAAEQMDRCATLTCDEYGPGHAKTKQARELAAIFRSRC